MLGWSKVLYSSFLLLTVCSSISVFAVSFKKSARGSLPSHESFADKGSLDAQSKALPGQIGAVVAAYIVVLILTGLGILFLRQRRTAEQAAISSEAKIIELREATDQLVHDAYESSSSPFGVPSIGQQSTLCEPGHIYPFYDTRSGTQHISPVAHHPYVNPIVAEAHKRYHQEALSDIYAHVMSQENAVAAGISPNNLPPPDTSMLPRRPIPSVAPQRSIFSRPFSSFKTKTKASTRSRSYDGTEKRKSRTASIISSLISPRRKSRVRDLEISEPTMSSFEQYREDENEPLTPRGPPPPLPFQQSSQYSYTCKEHNVPYHTTPIHSISEISFPITSKGEIVNSQTSTRNTPQSRIPAPFTMMQHENISQTSFTQPRSPPAITLTTPKSIIKNSTCPKSKNLVLNIPDDTQPRASLENAQKQAIIPQTGGTTNTAVSSQHPLLTPQNNPLNRPLALRQYTTNSPETPTPQSPMLKTTTLERIPRSSQQQRPLNSVGLPTAGGGLRTPWSAGAMPYSPYQPFTPVTPVTPRLLGRKELRDRSKWEERERRRRGVGVELVTPTEW